jgi:hypothetical protein
MKLTKYNKIGILVLLENKIKNFFMKRYFSSKKELILHPCGVTGYTDGEGCFSIKTIVAKTTKIGYTVRLLYQITVHSSDIEILYKLKAYFNNVGDIVTTNYYVSYRVTKLSDIINVIIPHFNGYPLQSTKLVSYYLFCAVANIMSNNDHLTLKGYKEVLSYKAAGFAYKKRIKCYYF